MKYAFRAVSLLLLAGALTGCPLPDEKAPAPSGAKGVVSTPPEMLFVPGGSFEMGNPFNDGPGLPDEKPVHSVTLFDYEIGKFEVTNQQIAEVYNWAWDNGRITDVTDRFVIAHDVTLVWINATASQVSFVGEEFLVETKDGVFMGDFPVVEITWYGAVAFCNWLSEMHGLEPTYDTSTWQCDRTRNGYRLPTEAEWERAASWTGSEHLTYGTGSHNIDCTRATINRCNPFGFSFKPLLTPVGFFNGDNGTIHSQSPIGAYDMSGNASEWVHDWYDENYYASSPGVDPDGPATGTHKVRRGGSWLNAPKLARSAARQTLPPGEGYDNTGFRLVRTPDLDSPLPRFTSEISDADLELGTRFRYDATATGEPTPTFALVEYPDGMRLFANIGRIVWVPTADQLGVANITLAAVNSLGMAEQSWSINVVDTRGPTRPNDLVATEIMSNSAVLSWSPSTDKHAVSGYRVYEFYRNSASDRGWRLVRDNIGGTSTTVNGLAADTFHRFRVSAFDPSGNESALSAAVSFTTLP